MKTNEPDWKSVADNFWYAAFHGDSDLMDHMVERYTDWFDEKDEEDYLDKHLKMEEGMNDE